MKDKDNDKNIKTIKKKQTSCAQEYNVIKSWFFIKINGSLKVVENSLENQTKTDLSTKTFMSNKTVLQKWRKNKCIPRGAMVEWIDY